tara:strand:+ start:479 stop:733 length:255 start_codon:yes stop_codon:yes gene_type:complete
MTSRGGFLILAYALLVCVVVAMSFQIQAVANRLDRSLDEQTATIKKFACEETDRRDLGVAKLLKDGTITKQTAETLTAGRSLCK